MSLFLGWLRGLCVFSGRLSLSNFHVTWSISLSRFFVPYVNLTLTFVLCNIIRRLSRRWKDQSGVPTYSDPPSIYKMWIPPVLWQCNDYSATLSAWCSGHSSVWAVVIHSVYVSGAKFHLEIWSLTPSLRKLDLYPFVPCYNPDPACSCSIG